MKKEILFAIFIGLTLGLIVTYGIYVAQKTLRNPAHQNGGSTIDASASPVPSPQTALTLLAPDDESIQDTTDSRVTGTTQPNLLVVIFINDQQPIITTTDQSGNFSVKATLQNGANTIIVRSISEDGNSAEEQRTVIVSTASLDIAGTASGSARVASPSPAPSVIPSPTGTQSLSPTVKSKTTSTATTP